MILMKNHVKRRDNYTCQKCGMQVSGSNCHVHHVIPVSHGNALSFEPLNMVTLCFHHHLNYAHKDATAFTDWWRFKFPERDAYIQLHREDEVHWKETDYLKMLEEAKAL